MKKALAIMTTLLLLGGVFAFTQISNWKMGKEYSVKFSGKGVEGIFKKMDAAISFDEANLAGSKFVITIDVASLNTGNALQNKHATGAEWFDAAKYPQIKFSTTSIEKSGAAYVAKGKMEVKGKVKDMSIPFSFSKSGAQGKFASSFVIKRSDFHVGEASTDVGDEIKVDVSVAATK